MLAQRVGFWYLHGRPSLTRQARAVCVHRSCGHSTSTCCDSCTASGAVATLKHCSGQMLSQQTTLFSLHAEVFYGRIESVLRYGMAGVKEKCG